MKTSTSPELSTFAADVLDGLSADPKHLSSKYFYDDEGSRLFQEIMRLPEYYLTDCELEIFTEQGPAICEKLADGRGLNVIELGAGDGTKTAVLIKHFLDAGADIAYEPIDISQEALTALEDKFHTEFPDLEIAPHAGDYFGILGDLKGTSRRRKLLLFLGSNIGNFSREASLKFFRSLSSVMESGDMLLAGFDLQKDPKVIVPAYDDAQGITAAFNLNLLSRINRELGADFNLDGFSHYANYRPIDGSARSFLLSRENQDVYIEALDRTFHFDQWEAIFMEISQKYTPRMIEEFAADSGFEIVRNYFDSRGYYCDSLWMKQ